MSPSQSAITKWAWGFHTLHGGIGPRDLRFRPQFVGVVKVWKDFSYGDGNLSSAGAAGLLGWPEGQLSPRAGFMSLSKSAITQWGWVFHILHGSIDPGDLGLGLGPQVFGVVKIWKDF